MSRSRCNVFGHCMVRPHRCGFAAQCGGRDDQHHGAAEPEDRKDDRTNRLAHVKPERFTTSDRTYARSTTRVDLALVIQTLAL